MTLGNASGDDVTITGSLASSVAIKTTFSYDIGAATLGLKSIYLGDSGSAARSTRIIGAAVASSYTLTLPTGVGAAGQKLATFDASGGLIFLNSSPSQMDNIGIAATVAASALTVALKGANGSDASATNPVYVTFRNATAATGTPTIIAITGALSVVVSSGSTLGQTSAQPEFVHVYLINNAGTAELAVSTEPIFDEGTLQTTTAEGGAGGADSRVVLYSTTARTSKGVRLIGRITSTQATAGTWATAPSEISLFPFAPVSTVDEVTCDTSNGFGSEGSNKIFRFTNSTTVGSGLTYADSATEGASVTVVRAGLYGGSISAISAAGGTAGIGISRNAVRTTGIHSLTPHTNLLCESYGPASGGDATQPSCAFTRRLAAGDVLRPHVLATFTPANTALVIMHITRISA